MPFWEQVSSAVLVLLGSGDWNYAALWEQFPVARLTPALRPPASYHIGWHTSGVAIRMRAAYRPSGGSSVPHLCYAAAYLAVRSARLLDAQRPVSWANTRSTLG